MTEETVQRLDYSKPPPGYQTSGRFWGFTGGGDVELRSGRDDAPSRSCLGRAALGIAAAWTDYKLHNDPPHLHPNDSSERMAAAFLCSVAEWRAAAWAWHDRRHALAARLPINADAWPRCLRWTDKECDQVDRWIADGEETAEPLWSLPSGGAAIVWPDNTPAAGDISAAVRRDLNAAILRDAPTEDPEVGALNEEALRDAQADVRHDDERVSAIRRDLEQAEQIAQRSRARARRLAGVSVEAFLAPPHLRPEDLARERASIPSGSIRCAQWDDGGRTVRLGLQLGEDGPGRWLEVSRQELGYHADPHGSKARGDDVEQVARLMDERGIADALQKQLEQAHALAGEALTARDKLREGVRLALAKLEAVAGAALGYAADGQRAATCILREVLE